MDGAGLKAAGGLNSLERTRRGLGALCRVSENEGE